MGRGLSDLQKRILTIALRNRTEGGTPQIVGTRQTRRGGVVTTYKRKTRKRLQRVDGQVSRAMATYISRYSADVLWCEVQSECFDAPAPGPKRAAAAVSISRAARRLQQRGLVECRSYSSWAGCDLTDEGVEVVKSLSVKNGVRRGVNQ